MNLNMNITKCLNTSGMTFGNERMNFKTNSRYGSVKSLNSLRKKVNLEVAKRKLIVSDEIAPLYVETFIESMG